MRFEMTELSADELALRDEVRAFVAEVRPPGSFEAEMVMASDPEFSRQLAARGWVGMAIPTRYGGGGRSAVERFLVAEELLRASAPVGHHWVADRQSGPQIEKFGTEEQKQRFLPGICRGEISFTIGMSEPDAGSDLSAVRTRATRVEGGWVVNGTKLWTTAAHRNDWCIVLCRTSDEDDRHAGLSQLLVDLHDDRVEVNTIPFLDGTADFNEVVLDDVFVPDDLVLGPPGMGWAQVTSELAYERGGPERWLETYPLLELFVREGLAADPAATATVGRLTARFWAIRQLSLSVARQIDQGGAPAIASALVKELGTRFEQDVLDALLAHLDLEPAPESDSAFERLLAAAVLVAPSFTIKGGTNEILRGIVAKGLR